MSPVDVGKVAAHLETKLNTVATLTQVGVLRPHRPDKLVRTGIALLRWGPTPAGGYTASLARFADEVAIIDDAGTLTFREVHERSNALAHALAAEGIGVGKGVAIMCRNHRGFIEATIAAREGRGQRDVPQHRLLRPPAGRRRAAREPRGDRL